MIILQQRVLWKEHPELVPVGDAPPAPNKPRTVQQAIELFQKAVVNHGTVATRRRFTTAFTHFLAIERLGDLPLSFDRVSERMVSLRASCPLTGVTQQKALYKLGEFWRYCVSSEWIARDPMVRVSVPKTSEIDQEDAEMIAPAEFDRLMEWVGRHHPRIVGLWLLWLRYTGMRPIEATRMRWSDIGERYFTIYGKATKGRRAVTAPDKLRKGVKRAFPLLDGEGHPSVPDLIPVLAELREYEPSQDGWLFPWRTIAEMQDMMRDASAALGVKVLQKMLRVSAVHYFREILGWDLELRSAVLGHSPAVQLRNYDPGWEAEELRVAIAKAGRRSGV